MENAAKQESNLFFNIIATIGAVLIFVGIAWLIAKNWHQIPSMLKILILVVATLSSFVSGVILRERNHEAPGRSLLVLGALLYILSVFLIAQIYSTSTTIQGTAWLLLLCWPIIALTAYFLDSKENLLISLIVLFIWVSVQYVASLSSMFGNDNAFMGFVLLYLSMGTLLYGLTALHSTINHNFKNVYRFWTVFYFLAVFYILSFQSMLPFFAEYSFGSDAMTIFLISIIIISFLSFMATTLFAATRGFISFKEILVFLGIIAVILVLILSAKTGEGLIGICSPVNCYDFNTESECNLAQSSLNCGWKTEGSHSYCSEIGCYDFNTESECNSADEKYTCEWFENEYNEDKGYCQQNWTKTQILEVEDNVFFDKYEQCQQFNNQKEQCVENKDCSWRPSSYVRGSLPTSLWLVWLASNIVFLGFIILVIWYGKNIGSRKIVNLGMLAFILDIISRYIGFWMDLSGYFAFSILAIIGGILLIFGAWAIPKWRRKVFSEISPQINTQVSN